MRVAVIGLGVIGKWHVHLLKKLNVEIVAVCDVDCKKLKDFADIKGYTEYLHVLDIEKPDVVHICTPHYLHFEMVVEALKRDINVLCEKPLCINRDELNAILNAEKQSKAKLGVCFQNRYNLSSIFVKDYLKDKRVLSAEGYVFWNRDEEYYSQAKWRGTKAFEGGGALINQAIHTVDLLQWLVGMPKSLVGWCQNISLQNVIEVEDTAVINCKGQVDFTLFTTTSSKKDFPTKIVIKTDSEEICLRPDSVAINEKLITEFPQTEPLFKKVHGEGHKSLFMDFYDCVEKGCEFAIDGKEGSKALKIVLATYESCGKEIKL